jgi:peroxiredoxin
MWKRAIVLAELVIFVFAMIALGFSAEPRFEYAPLSASKTQVPQTLLNLVHAAEVQAELGIGSESLLDFEAALREVDAVWWPSRIQPAEKQRKLVEELELQLISKLSPLLGEKGVVRLRQLELQSQSVRIMSRPEVARFLSLDSKQLKKIQSLFEETDRLGADAGKPNADGAKRKSHQEAKSGELGKVLAMLTPAQSQKLGSIVGSTFDTAALERIYPLAPELILSRDVLGVLPKDLVSLRGKVVLVHFYAYECHNCVANFKHYKRWDDKLKEKGVEVIGIQTPETSNERSPKNIAAAAEKEGFRFPVIMDLENKNWDAWGNTMWPTVYVIDKRGYIRFWWQGELNWQGATGDKQIESLVETLLDE